MTLLIVHHFDAHYALSNLVFSLHHKRLVAFKTGIDKLMPNDGAFHAIGVGVEFIFSIAVWASCLRHFKSSFGYTKSGSYLAGS